MDVACKPELADRYRVFTVQDPDVLDVLGLETGRKRFAYAELQPRFDVLVAQASAARELESAQRSPFQRAVLTVERNLADYQSLKYAFAPEAAFHFRREIEAFADVVRMRRGGQLDKVKAAAELAPVRPLFDARGPDAGADRPSRGLRAHTR